MPTPIKAWALEGGRPCVLSTRPRPAPALKEALRSGLACQVGDHFPARRPFRPTLALQAFAFGDGARAIELTL